MGSLLFGALCFGGGWIVGKFVPTPAFVQDFWTRYGWAKR